MSPNFKDFVENLIFRKVTIAPLVTFRILFGLLMLVSILRFWAKGWIHELYIAPKIFFPFIEGLNPLPGAGMYVVFATMALSTIMIILGFYYRLFSVLFFLLFTWVELLDKTNYLNHYYFISLISFLMIFLPVHRDFSLDVKWRKLPVLSEIPVVYINVLRLQMSILYFFAGIAKINEDWLLRAQPLKMWLAANAYKPVIGWIFQYKLTAYVFSWFGMLYDTTIPFFLAWRKTLPYAYVFVVVFHLMTWWLFPIGMFPFIMIVITTIFFPVRFHEQIVDFLKQTLNWRAPGNHQQRAVNSVWKYLMIIYFSIQLLLPFRYLVYPGNLYWTEQGYRFSWRVMLMEKAGQASFYVKDTGQEKAYLVPNYEFLTPQQEKMMATQPDMLVQYAHHLERFYKDQGMTDPVITAQVYVTLNGRPNRLFIDPSVDLTEVDDNWKPKKWILAYE